MAALRIEPEQALRDLDSGRALLVCAYDDQAKCERLRLRGALTMGELRVREAALPKDAELVFYCT